MNADKKTLPTDDTEEALAPAAYALWGFFPEV
jgi:hypothetical protein